MSTTDQQDNNTPEKKGSPIPLLIGSVIFIAVSGFVGWGLWQASHPTPVPLQGMVDAKTISVSAKIPGRLCALTVKAGDQVKVGDTVARIAIPEIEAKLAQVSAQEEAAKAKESLAIAGARPQQIEAAHAQVLRARAGLTLAQKTYDRVASLYKEGLIAAQRYDEALANLKSAKELLAAAQAQYSATKEGTRQQDKEAAAALVAQAKGGVAEVSSLANESDVRSPIAGEVTKVVMEEGEIAPAGFPLVLVVDLSDQWVVFNIREDELKNLKVGDTLKATLPALERDVTLSVYWINPRGDYATWRATRQNSGYDIRTFEVRARPTQKIEGMRPGMTAIVQR